MMKKYLILSLLFSAVGLFAQESNSIQQEINRTLWQPFKAAFETLNSEHLNDLYAGQVLRVTPNGIDTENKFKLGNLKRFEQYKEKAVAIQLDFWFDSRHTNSHTSYEVGYYRMILTEAKVKKTIYGQFHIVLQKIEGQWRITQDWDTATINGKAITANDFDTQDPILFE